MSNRLAERSSDFLSPVARLREAWAQPGNFVPPARKFARLWNALDDLPILFRLDVALFEHIALPAPRRIILAERVPLYAAAH